MLCSSILSRCSFIRSLFGYVWFTSLHWPIEVHKYLDEMENVANLSRTTARKKSSLPFGILSLKCIIFAVLVLKYMVFRIRCLNVMYLRTEYYEKNCYARPNLACYCNSYILYYYPSFRFNPFFDHWYQTEWIIHIAFLSWPLCP
jgi:hypothetical protein